MKNNEESIGPIVKKTFVILGVIGLALTAIFFSFRYANTIANNGTNDIKPVPTNSDMTPQPTSSASIDDQDDYKGWKTYTNDQLSFEFKYPPGWAIAENDAGLVFGTTIGKYNYSQSDDSQGMIDVRSEFFDYGKGTPGPKISEEQIFIDGVIATKRVYEGDSIDEIQYPLTRLEIYQTTYNSRNYYIDFTSAKKNSEYWSNFENLLASWKFK